MKKVVILSLLLLLFLFLLPLFLFGGDGLIPLPSGEAEGSTLLPPQITPTPRQTADGGVWLTLLRQETGQVERLTLKDYLWGVAAAEMPASFHSEAIKAQVVAARTYALRKGSQTVEAHPDAMVCDDFTCCQAFRTPEDMAAVWGEDAAFYGDKLTGAVEETDALVLTYGGLLIDAVFHSSSQTSTADAAEVWGRAVPYLKPVPTPEGEEVPNYHTTVTVPLEEFQRVILDAHPEAVFSEDYTTWFGPVSYTAAGAVAILPVGGVPLSGREYRALFSLRSPRFSLTAGEEGVVFEVTGYGHGAGMSQYGANAMAGTGSGFREILTHYYTGCEIEKMPS